MLRDWDGPGQVGAFNWELVIGLLDSTKGDAAGCIELRIGDVVQSSSIIQGYIGVSNAILFLFSVSNIQGKFLLRDDTPTLGLSLLFRLVLF